MARKETSTMTTFRALLAALLISGVLGLSIAPAMAISEEDVEEMFSAHEVGDQNNK